MRGKTLIYLMLCVLMTMSVYSANNWPIESDSITGSYVSDDSIGGLVSQGLTNVQYITSGYGPDFGQPKAYDIDNDSIDELIVADTVGNNINVFNVTGGVLLKEYEYAVGGNVSGPFTIYEDDIDNDGFAEILFWNQSGLAGFFSGIQYDPGTNSLTEYDSVILDADIDIVSQITCTEFINVTGEYCVMGISGFSGLTYSAMIFNLSDWTATNAAPGNRFSWTGTNDRTLKPLIPVGDVDNDNQLNFVFFTRSNIIILEENGLIDKATGVVDVSINTEELGETDFIPKSIAIYDVDGGNPDIVLGLSFVNVQAAADDTTIAAFVHYNSNLNRVQQVNVAELVADDDGLISGDSEYQIEVGHMVHGQIISESGTEICMPVIQNELNGDDDVFRIYCVPQSYWSNDDDNDQSLYFQSQIEEGFDDSYHSINKSYSLANMNTDIQNVYPDFILGSGIMLSDGLQGVGGFESYDGIDPIGRSFTRFNSVIPIDIDGDEILDVCGMNSTRIFCLLSDFTNQQATYDNNATIGSSIARESVNSQRNAYVFVKCLNDDSNVTFRGSECSGTIDTTCSYNNDLDADLERFSTTCGNNSVNAPYLNSTFSSSSISTSCSLQCEENLSSCEFNFNLYLQDNSNPDDYSESVNIQVNVINGTKGIDCSRIPSTLESVSRRQQPSTLLPVDRDIADEFIDPVINQLTFGNTFIKSMFAFILIMGLLGAMFFLPSEPIQNPILYGLTGFFGAVGCAMLSLMSWLVVFMIGVVVLGVMALSSIKDGGRN